MEDRTMSERLQVVMSEDELAKLLELAEANAGSNKSLMIRKLINLAWENHATMGLYTPKVYAPSAMAN
jgi:hypothetical protein